MAKKGQTACKVKRKDLNHCGMCGSGNIIFQGVLYCYSCEREVEVLTSIDNMCFLDNLLNKRHRRVWSNWNKELIQIIEDFEKTPCKNNFGYRRHNMILRGVFKCLDCKAVSTKYSGHHTHYKINKCPVCSNNVYKHFNLLWRKGRNLFCTCGYNSFIEEPGY